MSRLNEQLKKFARRSFLAFSIGAAVLGGLNEGKTTRALYEASAQTQISYKQGEPRLYVKDEHQTDKQDPTVELVRIAVAFVMTHHSFCVRQGCPFTSLISGASGFTYAIKSSPVVDDPIRTVMISLPTNPFELEDLKSLLRRHSFFYSIDDGSGYFHGANTFQGLSLT